MFDTNKIQDSELEKFGNFGKSYVLSRRQPSLIELCRYCMSDEKLSSKLLQLFENYVNTLEYKEFERIYYHKSGLKSKILQNYWNELKIKSLSSSKLNFHSSRRKLLSLRQNTKLREYQIECSKKIIDLFNSNNSTLLVLPTGAGKTKTVVHSLRDLIDCNSKALNILWLVNKAELCAQAENAVHESWLESRGNFSHKQLWINSVYGGGFPLSKNMFNDTPSFTISTPDAIAPDGEGEKWADTLKDVFDIIVVDEAHHGLAEQKRMFDKWPKAHRIGVTATPELVSGVEENHIFHSSYSELAWPEKFVKKNGGDDFLDTRKILIQHKYLSDYGNIIGKDIAHEADCLGLDFNRNKGWQHQISPILVAEKLCQMMINDEGCNRILLFVNGVPQGRAIAGFLRDSGINASAVYGELKAKEVKSRINGFSLGHFQVLVSVDILREGIDVPLVDGILTMRKGLKEHEAMFTQMIGRGLRGPKSGGTDKCLIWHVV